MEYKDYYKIMGLAKSATKDEVKRAYKKLARKYHPDVSKEKDAEAKFKELGEAYEVLKDTEKRAAYDQLGEHWKVVQEALLPQAGMLDLNLVAVIIREQMPQNLVTFLSPYSESNIDQMQALIIITIDFMHKIMIVMPK